MPTCRNDDRNVEETVSVILSDPPCKEGNARFTTIPLKPNQICGRYRRFPGSKSHISETANEI